QIIFGERRCHRRGEAQKLRMRAANFFFEARIGHFARAEDLNLTALQSEIRRLQVRVKVVAGLDDAIVETRKIFQQLARALSRVLPRALPGRTAVAAGPTVCPIEAPVERTYHTIIVHRREPGFPVVHPFGVARGHQSSRNTITGRRLATWVSLMAGFSTQQSALSIR